MEKSRQPPDFSSQLDLSELGTSSVPALNKIDMKVVEAGSATEAILGALVAAALGIISTALLAALTATVIRYAVRNDPHLYGTEVRATGV